MGYIREKGKNIRFEKNDFYILCVKYMAEVHKVMADLWGKMWSGFKSVMVSKMVSNEREKHGKQIMRWAKRINSTS